MKKYIKRFIPKYIRAYPRRSKLPEWKGDFRIFCISFQRTGTTSFGDFFEHFEYPRAGYGISMWNKWSKAWFEERYDDIFNSKDFQLYQVYEDNPWWYTDFYIELYKRYPNSKFVLQIRDPKKWFASMKSLSGGRTLGNTKRHARVYDRWNEFEEKLKTDPSFKPTDNDVDNLMSLEGMDEHYIQIYEKHIENVKNFFKKESPESLLVVDLQDTEKWNKIANFVGLDIPENFKMHSNKSKV